jgi:hypothetical protein
MGARPAVDRQLDGQPGDGHEHERHGGVQPVVVGRGHDGQQRDGRVGEHEEAPARPGHGDHTGGDEHRPAEVQ